MAEKQGKWEMPEWMEEYQGLLFTHNKAHTEELVNCGSEVNVFNNAPKALMCLSCKAKVDLLNALHQKGKI